VSSIAQMKFFCYNVSMKGRETSTNQCWRKSRIAARLLLKNHWTRRDQRLAQKLADDPAVENRLIDQALASLAAK